MCIVLPMSTKHFQERLTERIVNDAGMDEALAAKVAQALNALAAKSAYKGGEAVIYFKADRQVNQAWGEKSNGNLCVAIFRGGRVITTFLRRETQPLTPSALQVEKVTNLTK